MGRDGDNNNKRKSYGGRGGGGRGGGKKHKYISRAAGSGQALPSNSRGILITCDSPFERKASDEALQMIEEHYAKLAPEVEDATSAASSSGAKDFGALLAAEMASLKDKKSQKLVYHDTGVKGTVFIKFPEEPAFPGPVEVVKSLCEEAREKQQCRGRHVQRFLPVERTCFASLSEIQRVAKILLPTHFGALKTDGVRDYIAEARARNAAKAAKGESVEEKEGEGEEEEEEKEKEEEKEEKEEEKEKKEEKEEEKEKNEEKVRESSSHPSLASVPVPPVSPLSYSVEYEHRASDTFERLELINVFTDLIPIPPHRINLSNPDKTIIVQVIRNAAAVSVVGSYKTAQKFNLRKLAEPKEDEEKEEGKGAASKEEGK